MHIFGAIETRTPLFEEHIQLNAKMVDFSGWYMPVQYTNVIDEHTAVRTKAGIFDTCHMGEFMIEGEDTIHFLQKIVAKDMTKLQEGKCFYTVMCNESGGVIDDLFIYKFNDNKCMLVVNAGTIEKDFKHLITSKENYSLEIRNISAETAKLDIQGPEAETITQQLIDTGISQLKRFQFREIILNSTEILISRSGYTGEDGFELYFKKEKAVEIWNKLLEAGKGMIKPAGLGARDTLRLECCYSLYGHELSDKISPIEAGIDFALSFGKQFIGKEALERVKENPKRKKVAFELLERGVPREHYGVFKGDKEIGYVTSGTMSPTFKKGIGMALIDIQHTELGNEIDIKIREKPYKAKIVKIPFYEYRGKR